MTGRVFDRAFAWQASTRQVTAAAHLLAAAAARDLGPPGHVIGIARGGLVPARAIARATSAPLTTVTAAHNPTNAPYTAATGHVTITRCLPDLAELHGPVLVIDDICGTGATLQAVTAALAAASPAASMYTLTLCHNAGAPMRPDYTIWDDLREWVIFPWEPRPAAGLPVRALAGPTEVHRA